MTALKFGPKPYRLAEARCLECGKLVDAATSIAEAGEEKRPPEEGDIVVCFRCGHVMIYADGEGTLRQPTDEEIVEIAGDQRIVAFLNFRGPALEKEEKRLKSLPNPPRRIAALPLDERGYPVPWFVQWMKDGRPVRRGEGEPDFRVVSEIDRIRAFRQGLCWICGQPMGVHRVYAIGPMCVVNRVTMEPASHRDCAEYAVKACPFLARPRMKRLPKDDLEGQVHAAGAMIERNPGTTCLYETREAKPFDAGNGWLIKLGRPERVDWWAQGRKATRAEVLESIESGLPNLAKLARLEGSEAIAELERQRLEAWKLLPAEA
jgi:hypothetical protein